MRAEIESRDLVVGALQKSLAEAKLVANRSCFRDNCRNISEVCTLRKGHFGKVLVYGSNGSFGSSGFMYSCLQVGSSFRS